MGVVWVELVTTLINMDMGAIINIIMNTVSAVHMGLHDCYVYICVIGLSIPLATTILGSDTKIMCVYRYMFHTAFCGGIEKVIYEVCVVLEGFEAPM